MKNKEIKSIIELQNATAGTQFAKDMAESFSVNGSPMPRGYWNLIVSIRDCKLFSKGIKPTRHWKISDVKKYFGIKGDAEAMATTLEKYRDIICPPKEEDKKSYYSVQQ